MLEKNIIHRFTAIRNNNNEYFKIKNMQIPFIFC